MYVLVYTRITYEESTTKIIIVNMVCFFFVFGGNSQTNTIKRCSDGKNDKNDEVFEIQSTLNTPYTKRKVNVSGRSQPVLLDGIKSKSPVGLGKIPTLG